MRLASASERLPAGVPWVAAVGVSAAHQTRGRGRSRGTGRIDKGAWVDTEGSMIVSIGFLDDLSEKAFPVRVAKSAAVAVCQTVSMFATGARVSLKWPNDVLIAGRKVSGVLVETFSSKRSVRCTILGVGVNVLKAPAHIPDAAAVAEFSSPVALEEFREVFLKRLDGSLAHPSETLRTYETSVALPGRVRTPKGGGRPLRYNNGVVTVETRSGTIDITDADVLVVEG